MYSFNAEFCKQNSVLFCLPRPPWRLFLQHSKIRTGSMRKPPVLLLSLKIFFMLMPYCIEVVDDIPDFDGNIEFDEDGLQTCRAVTQHVLPILFQVGYLTIKAYISDLRRS